MLNREMAVVTKSVVGQTELCLSWLHELITSLHSVFTKHSPLMFGAMAPSIH